MINKITLYLKGLVEGGFFYIFIGNILTKLTLFISSVVVVRMVDKSEYAFLAYADNLFSYVALFSGLGMASAVLMFCTSSTEKERNKAYLLFAAKWGAIFDISVSFVVCVVLSFIEIPFPEARVYIWLLLFAPMINYYLHIIQSYNRAQMFNRQYALMGFLHAVFTCVLSIVFVAFIGMKGSVLARYIAAIAAIIYGVRFVLLSLKGHKVAVLSMAHKKAFMKMSVSLMIASLFSMIMPINETFLVNNMIQDAVVTAEFRIAGLFPQQINIIVNAIIIYYFPVIAKMNEGKTIFNLSRKVGIMTFVTVGGIVIIGIILTPLIIKIVYGDKYLGAVGISVMMWVMYGLNAAIRMFPMNMLAAVGRTTFSAVMSVVTCVIHFILDFYLIKTRGVSGVVYASIIVYAISGMVYWMYLYKTCKNKGSLV